MNADGLLRRADELLDDYVDCEFYPMGADAVIRNLAAALRAERSIAETNYTSLSDALHTEQDRTHRYHERAERAERERDALRALLREARTVVLPAWVGASPKPTHLAITPERQSLADRIDALIGEKP